MRATSRMTIEPAAFRRLRQRHQQRRFRQRQPLRLLAEIGDRGGADAFEIAAERRQRQIEIEDLVLGQLPLDLDRAHHLAQLGIDRALAPRLHQPRQLHRDGRAAGDDATAGDELQRGAAQRQRIDAVMRVETPVLVGQQQLEIGRIDAGLAHRPAAASGRRPSHRRATACRCGRRPWSRPAGPAPAATGRARRPRRRRRRSGSGRRQSTPPRCERSLPPPSWPGLSRPSTSFSRQQQSWMPGSKRRLHDGDCCWCSFSLISPDAPRPCRCRCGRSARDCTCPRHRPAAARICRATPRAPHRPP